MKWLDPRGYFATTFIYREGDQNAAYYLVLGSSIVGLLNNGIEHIVPVAISAGALQYATEGMPRVGISHFYSIVSGYLIYIWHQRRASYLTKLVATFLVLQNVGNWLVNEGPMHFQGHFLPTLQGYATAWIAMEYARIKVRNL